MEREILFRGKRKDTQKTVYGYYLKLNSAETLYIIVDEHGEYHRIIPETVGQFTGLTDKKGVRIFEGDIIVWDYDKPDIDGSTHTTPEVVQWNEKYCGFANDDGTKIDEYCRIIGNVHDNPEILKGEPNA